MNLLMRVSRISIIKKLQLIISKHLKLGLKTPKSKAIFEKTNQLVEKYSKIGLFVIKNVIVPCFIFPKAIVSFFIYFTTNLGNDAFYLPASIW